MNADGQYIRSFGKGTFHKPAVAGATLSSKRSARIAAAKEPQTAVAAELETIMPALLDRTFSGEL